MVSCSKCGAVIHCEKAVEDIRILVASLIVHAVLLDMVDTREGRAVELAAKASSRICRYFVSNAAEAKALENAVIETVGGFLGADRSAIETAIGIANQKRLEPAEVTLPEVVVVVPGGKA